MSDQPLKDLDPRIRKQVEKARNGLQSGNAGFAIQICMGLLEKFPGCVEIREVLRNAQKSLKGGKNAPLLSQISAKPLAFMGSLTMKKDPAKAMMQAEKILKDDPDCVAALKLLGEAAILKGLPHTAVFAFEGAHAVQPKDADVAKKLANLYLEVDRIEDCIRTCDRILKEYPGDGEAQEIVKRASVAQSMDKGKWEEEGDFRTKLKDKTEAESLEQSSRSTTSEENVEKLIEDTRKRIEEEPENLNNYRQISNYYRRIGDYDSAIHWIREARKLEAGKTDVTLERIETRLVRDQIDDRIAGKRGEIEADPENERLKSELEQMLSDRQKYLLEQAADMVKRYPNDYTARHQYGELLLEEGKVDEAIQQLQIAQRNPKVRISSLHLLGRSYKTKGFFDMAAEQLDAARAEINGMTEKKKEVVYDLAQCYEEMGEKEKAINHYKEIYAADIGFRDVSKKIDEFYGGRNK
ncbi:MAG: tetratricopeptide repeat protein [Puniceicoccaceae bacterium]